MLLPWQSFVSMTAGLFAALTSLFGKMIFIDNISAYVCMGCQPLDVPLRVFLFILTLVSNSLMWTLFAHALSRTSSTVQTTVTQTAANFVFSAAFGWVLFGESATVSWYIGFFFILAGVYILNNAH